MQPILYRFASRSDRRATIAVNGRPSATEVGQGYAVIRRSWEPGDVVRLSLPMPVRRVLCHEKVEANVGRVALQRGAIVYCAEWPDNADGHVLNLLLEDDASLAAEFRSDLLGGVEVVVGEAIGLSRGDRDGAVVRRRQPLMAIPYYAWAHRGKGEMAVWLAREPWAARPLPGATIASTGRATASRDLDPGPIRDQIDPASSGDHSCRFLHWWPRKGTLEWVQYEFEEQAVSAVEIYWFDDTGRGECRIPKSWRLVYREGGAWRPVTGVDSYGVAKDAFNRTTFDAVRTEALRVEVQLPEGFSAGIHEWRVE